MYKNYIPICLACNDKYIKYASVLLQSVIENSSSENFYDIVILTTDIHKENKKTCINMFENYENFTLRFSDVSHIIKKYSDILANKQSSLETYYRFFALDVFDKYEKVLYLDCDTIVLDDVAKLFETDLTGKYAGVVTDSAVINLEFDNITPAQVNGSKNTKFEKHFKSFNAGVILLNLKEIRKDFTVQSFFDVTFAQNQIFRDKDILNYLFHGKLHYFPQEWNMTADCFDNINYKLLNDAENSEFNRNIKAAVHNPRIVYYNRAVKPWSFNSFEQENYSHNYFWKYARKSPYYRIILNDLKSQVLPQIQEKFESYNNDLKFLTVNVVDEPYNSGYVLLELYTPNFVDELFISYFVDFENDVLTLRVNNFDFERNINNLNSKIIFNVRDNRFIDIICTDKELFSQISIKVKRIVGRNNSLPTVTFNNIPKIKNNKIRLLFVITQMYKGGAENTTLELFKNLSPEKYDMDFCVLNQCDFERPTNLLPEIPKHINIIDYIDEQYKKGIFYNWCNSTEQMEIAAKMLGEYDWAFHIGEWWSPEFVADYVKSKYKAIWLHNDLNLIPKHALADDNIRDYAKKFSKFLFVSEGSRINSLKLFPFMEDKSTVVHNLINFDSILMMAAEELLPEDRAIFNTDLPVLATVANIRPEKKHIRNLEIMIELKKRGIRFKWLNIGIGDAEIVNQLEKLIAENGLQEDFLLLGTRLNPYSLMKRCDAITVLSDVESWSLVITESLCLNVPVIATPTSGAVEQITDGKNGLLTDGYSIENIVDTMQKVLSDKSNFRKFNVSNDYDFNRGIKDFVKLVDSKPKEKKVRSLMYVIDGVNYVGGAHLITFKQINVLKHYYNITVLTKEFPNERVQKELYGVRISYWDESWEIQPFMEMFDCVIVMSEGSFLREIVSGLKKPKKINWIHQCYADWYQRDDYNRWLSEKDAEIYSHFDTIVNLSPICLESFISVHPNLKNKAVAIRNFAPDVDIGFEFIGKKNLVDKDYLNIVTIARFHVQKNIFGYLTIARMLKFAGVKFHWYIFGDGQPLKGEFDSVVKLFNLENDIITPGNVHKPYPMLAQMDLFVLFSHYEGTPVTIEEAQLLGVPVIARNLGGTADMVINGENAVLVDGDETDCFRAIVDLINDKEKYNKIKSNLPIKKQDNKILEQLLELFG
jgi:lipopolysaccharide biosynthesis glycosyltransferase/glycosyltransferase involved in cell wall biosynthesis